MKRLSVLLVAGALGVASLVSAGQEPAARSGDREFINDAGSANLMEVEGGKLAASHASNERVKAFGKRMVTDHSKAYDALKQLAQRKNIPVPAEMTDKHRQTVGALSSVKGKEFDRVYMQMMVTDHEEDVEKFRKESREAEDPDVRAYAAKTLPTLESHLDMAREVYASVGGGPARAGR
jgi:putative membrane protein